MSDTAISNLQQAVKTAAGTGGAFALDAAFLTKGLNDASVTVPADYDQIVMAAFQLAAASDLSVKADQKNVGAVTGNSFTVTNATIPFLSSTGVPLQTTATLVFAVTTDAKPTLVVQIASAPSSWTWTNSFEFMGGWPFNQLPVTDALFVFSTADGTYPWTNSAASKVKGGGKQNFSAALPLPSVVQPFLKLFSGLTPAANLTLQGVLDMTAYNGTTVLMPPGTLTATLQNGQFSVFYLTVSNPSIAVSIPAPTDDTDDSGQAPTLAVSALLGVGGVSPEQSPYILQVQISPAGTQDAVAYGIGLNATGAGTPLTPDSIVSLIGGNGSYFSGTPSVLQQFLAFVALQGMTINGTLNPATVGQVSILVGSMPNTSWTPIPYPPPGLDFSINEFSLQWSMSNPLDSTRSQSFLFETQFTLMPSIFKGPDGVGDGVFTVRFDSALNFSAMFGGSVSLSDFLSTLSGGAVSLPPSIEASLSDIALTVDFNAKSFNLSSAFDVELAFLTVNDEPILSISDGNVSIGAMTPPQGKSQQTQALSLLSQSHASIMESRPVLPQTEMLIRSTTVAASGGYVWSGSVGGLLGVGPLKANVVVSYDGTLPTPQWNLKAALAQPITVQELIRQFFAAGGVYDFPDFLPGTLTITTFAIAATIPTSSCQKSATTYTIDVSFSWLFTLGDQKIGLNPAKIGLKYDGSLPSGQQFSGMVAATWVYEAINLELLLTYKFAYVQNVANQTLSLTWQGFTATYTSKDNQIAFTLKGWSIGSLIQALVRTLGDPYFTLSSPWDLLNQISLDGLSVIVSLQNGLAFSQRLSASYTLSSPLNLGFIVINSLIFRRDTTGKVTLAIDGSSPISSSLGSLMDPKKGQDVQNLPPVPGRGNDYFKVFLLVLGQRIGISGSSGFANTQAVINALQKVPSTTGKLNPVNPAQGTTPGLPYYNPSNNWLIAGHLGLLRVGSAWTVDLMVVFNDPNLYGLRLALAGTKAGGLAGLAIDILYKKITDDVGLFQINFTFPDSIRNINLGAVSITLPQIGIQIYTNGDFLIDIGFPYNLDFSRSFAIYAIVYGVPVMGAGGFYFGKLSSATATQVPQTTKGTFDPVIVFGIGLQLGLGYNFTKGPLSAGFALTVFGIIEGVIAAWHPYPGQALQRSTTALGDSMQSDYYFKLSGTVGVIGLLYGKIDFAIISATINVKIVLSLQITYESYRAIPLVATASVDVSLTVKINLGLFSISISFSFHMKVTAQFVIGADETAPWDGASTLPLMQTSLLHAGPDAVTARAALLQPRLKTVVRKAGVTVPTLKVLASPQFTVLAPEAATAYKQQQGAFVFLLAMDAPTATSTTSTGNTSFDQLAAAFFPWVIDALSQSQGDEVDLEDASATIVTREQLEAYVKKLADLADPPLNMPGLLNFMASSFILNIETPAYAKSSGDQSLFQQGASVFPVFDGLSLTVPDPAGGSATKPVTFETYATATSSYRQFVAETFAEVEANIEAENQSQAPKTQNAVDDPESMAALIFIDYFSMMGRQLLQAARNLLDGYAYPLQSTDSIASIITAANALGNNLQIADVAVPNQDHQLTPNLSITLPPSSYAIQSTDTLNSIAAQFSDTNSSPRWTTTPAQLISANGTARILLPGISLTINSKTYTTVPGDSFQSIADAFAITLPALAQQTILYNTRPLLVSASQMIVPGITYKTGTSDTLSTVAAQFATTVPLLAGASSTVQGLFSTAAEQGVITLANLQAWSVGGLWTAIQTTDQVAQTAGMVSRFLMYGLRLPSAAGLSLSSQFLFPAGQKEYALYQLTGQEFPTSAPATVKSFPVTVNAAASSHKVNLSFIQFNGAAGSGTAIDLTAPYASLSTVLTWAQGGSFQPSPSFAVLPQSIPQPKQFAANNYAYWTTSDLAGLQSLTNRGSSSNGNSSGQMQPTLWPLPSGLLSLTEARQATLSPLVGDMKKMIPLLPEFQPQRGQTSPAGQQTKYSDLDNWAWTTRVDFQIKRLPVGGASSGGAGDTPNGAASAPTLPNVYEVIGASTEGAQTLELLLRSMDSLGEDIVSGLFLLYPQSGSNISLTTLGAQEFLAFMTQTNLSTETNPARSLSLALATLSTAPRGIANAPGEFIKLLWELSVVRSGGYFLFYQVVDGGGGLPASIFDPSGTATMSMVVTFAAQGAFSFGEIAPGFVNSFVTTDNLNTATDAVQLISQPTSGASLPLTGLPGETIATLSALYGAGPGAIVESNQTIPLKTGAVVPIAGIVRQLTQADVTNPGQTLANLATYYSQGAQTAITAADIQNFNPGVQVALGAVFYIPPVNYVVNAVNAPGNTFAKMAAYYALSLDALAVNALNVGGLFSQNTVLAVNTQVFDLRSTLGPGNVSFELSRTNYGDPPDNPADPGYPQTYMYSLYNNLSAGLLSNVYTKSDSPMGLPFGPQVENDEQEQAFASHAKLAEHRRALLAAATLDDFEYTQSIGFAQFAQINPAPSNPAPGSPPASANPYVGVGGTLQIALRWQDIFGNTTITPFSQPPTSYKGALNGSAATVLYSDRLVGLSGWTSTMSNYIYAGTAGSPVLNLSLTFDPTPYIGNAGQAKRDLALYQKIYFQLNQDYTNLNVPGVNDNAVTMSLSNSLLASPVNSLSPAQAGSIRGYVSACVQYLAAIVHASTPQPVPSALVSFPVSVGDIDSSSNIIELDVTLVLTRNPLLTDPAIASLTDGLSVSGTVLPKPDVGEQPGEEPAYVGFATAFETVFKTADWYMKVGEGMQLESDAGDNNTALQLWAVRFGTATGQGIFFQIVEDEPSYYAPKPIATTLASKTVQIVDYTTQNTITASFNGVDQNQWFQTCLDAIDTFLSATDSTSTFILDKLLGTDDPLKDGYLGLVLQAKESLANSISSAVEPILSTSLADSSTRWFAQQKLRQQFLNQIGAAYAAGAAVVYEVNDVSGASSDNPAGPPNLYGQPGGQIPGSDNQGNQNFTLTASRIPLAQTKDNGNIYDPRLCFVFTTKNVAGQAYVPLNLTLDITHLEFNRSTVPGIEGYVQSQWLVFVNGPFSYDLNTNTAADIPVVNRNLPTPPTVQEQTAGQVYFSPAVSPEVPPTTPLDLTQWNYSFEYLYRFAAQDTVRTTIQLNVPTSSVSAAAFTSGPDLFTALAQFVSSYPAILADFGEYLVKIDAETSEPTDKATIDGAKKAVDAFQTYLNQVAVAYAASLVPLTAAFAALPKLVEIDFETALDTDPQTGGARTNILNLQINEIDATWDSSAGTISNGVVTLPAVVLAIAPDQYTPVVPTDAESLSYVYQLTGSKPAKYLPYDAALNNPLRTVSLPNLDVLLYQNGLAEISVDRNRILFPVGSAITTNPDFIFTTPWVSFSNPVVPRLTYATFSLDGAGTSGESLEQLLNDFFAGLFTGGDGTVSVEATMTGMYNYQMQTGFPVSLPICLLPPVETPVSPTMIPTFTSVVAAAVADWIKQQHPTTGGNAQVGFKLTLFGSEEKQPLMVIDDLYHAVSGNGTAQSQTAAPAKRKPQRKRRR